VIQNIFLSCTTCITTLSSKNYNEAQKGNKQTKKAKYHSLDGKHANQAARAHGQPTKKEAHKNKFSLLTRRINNSTNTQKQLKSEHEFTSKNTNLQTRDLNLLSIRCLISANPLKKQK
jgi:hypothetical protein